MKNRPIEIVRDHRQIIVYGDLATVLFADHAGHVTYTNARTGSGEYQRMLDALHSYLSR